MALCLFSFFLFLTWREYNFGISTHFINTLTNGLSPSMLTPSRGICHFGRQPFTALLTFRAESAAGGRGWGEGQEGGQPGQLQFIRPGIQTQEERKRERQKNLHNSQSNCCLLGNEAAVWDLCSSLLAWAGKTRDGPEGRCFPPFGGILKKDLFSSHSSGPLLFPQVSQLQYILCGRAS